MKKLLIIALILSVRLLPAQIDPYLGEIPYTNCSFDAGDCEHLILDTAAPGNIWRIGAPQKLVFNAPHSEPNVLITDTVNAYPAGNHSYFDLAVDFNAIPFYGNIIMSFYHKLNTDSLTEGGYVEVSYDKGMSWVNVVNDVDYFDFNTENCYTQTDTISGGIPAFTGNINEWTWVRLQWIYYIPIKEPKWPTDTIMFRFNFVSDDIETARDGWMIDDISFSCVNVGTGFSETEKNQSVIVFPNPSSGVVNFKSHDIKIKHLEILNSNGLPVSSYKYILNNIFIFEEEISPGAYFYKAELENRKIVEGKFIIK